MFSIQNQLTVKWDNSRTFGLAAGDGTRNTSCCSKWPFWARDGNALTCHKGYKRTFPPLFNYSTKICDELGWLSKLQEINLNSSIFRLLARLTCFNKQTNISIWTIIQSNCKLSRLWAVRGCDSAPQNRVPLLSSSVCLSSCLNEGCPSVME